MRANVWSGRNTVQVENVPDPKILNASDAIVRITSTAICGSDLHLYDGYIPTMKHGDILGHEFMGEVVETGPGVQRLKAGRPRRRAVPHRVRPLLGVRAPALLGLRELQPQRRDRREAVRPPDRRHLRVLAHHRRLRRRPGRVRARAVRRRGAVQRLRLPPRDGPQQRRARPTSSTSTTTRTSSSSSRSSPAAAGPMR